MNQRVYVAGVGMLPFKKPGTNENYDVMAEKAIRDALTDAGLDYSKVQQAYAGFCYGESTSGQKSLYRIGTTGIPVINVNNNCATGSTALFLARQAIQHGIADCVLAFGFEQMRPGALKSTWEDRPSALLDFQDASEAIAGNVAIPRALRLFGGAGKEHMEKYGTKLDTFAKIRSKASLHAAKNPHALFRNKLSPEDVLASEAIWPGVLHRLMACPPTCGAAATVLVSDRFATAHGIEKKIFIAGQGFATDTDSTFGSKEMIRLVGFDMTRAAAHQAYEESGIDPADTDVIELHDCFAQNELLTYEGLGLCPEGEGEKLVIDADNTYGGRFVINPSGGLLAKGHPLGATGLAQCFELTHQLRQTAGARQVAGARLAIQHNLGLGGACVVTVYQSV
ncbi:lipid-transfer protein [Pusillimonas sp. TS35]|nr:lipid-transfer protein [Pusillimonas sp. TS35]